MATLARKRPAKRRKIHSSTLFTSEEGRKVRVPVSAYSFTGFRRWIRSDGVPEQLKALFSNGEVSVDMSKENLEHHNKVKMEIACALSILNRQLKIGSYYGDGARISNPDAQVSNNTDGVFISKSSIRSKRVRLLARAEDDTTFLEIEGSPDMVLEVVSNSSVDKDNRLLREAYHLAGIDEYWIVDARGEDISFQILRWTEAGYVAAPTRAGWRRSRVFECEFRLMRETDDVGLLEYTLENR